MPGEANSPEGSTEKIEGIPLHLIATIITNQIKQKRESVFQITVKKKFHHRYTVIVETRDEYTQRVNQESSARTEGDGHG